MGENFCSPLALRFYVSEAIAISRAIGAGRQSVAMYFFEHTS